MEISEVKCLQTAPASISAGTVHRAYGSTFKSRLLFIAKVAVAILTLFILVKSIQLSTLMAVLKTSNLNYLAMALIFVVPNVWIQVLKWHFLLKLANPDISLAIAYKSFIVGYPLGFVTPGRLGEFGRAFYVKELNQMKTFKLVIVDKSTNLLIILLFGFAGFLILSQNDLTPNIRFALFTILGIITGTLFYLIAFTASIHKVLARFTRIYHFSRKNNLSLLVFSTAFYFIFLAQFILLILNFQSVNPISAAVAAASVFLVKTMLPISIADLGIREGAAIYFFNKIGLNTAIAFNAAILLFIFNVGIPSLIGLITLLNTRRTT